MIISSVKTKKIKRDFVLLEKILNMLDSISLWFGRSDGLLNNWTQVLRFQALALFKKIDFWVVHLGVSVVGTPKLCQNIFQLNTSWYQKKAPELNRSKIDFFGLFGSFLRGGTPKLCPGICLFVISWYTKN